MKTCLIVILMLHSFSQAFGQAINWSNYKDGDTELIRFLSLELQKNSEDLISLETSAVVFCVVSALATGEVDSIYTLNSGNSIFAGPVLKAVQKTRNCWLPAAEPYYTIIPVFFVFGMDFINKETGKSRVSYVDSVPTGENFPLRGRMVGPIVIRMAPVKR